MFDDDSDELERGHTQLPIFKKGHEIIEVVDQICDLIPDDKEHLGDVKSIMLEDVFN